VKTTLKTSEDKNYTRNEYNFTQVVAGGFKRADPSLSEQAVLMRSLRDTNVAKIDGDDLKIFMGLLEDLFPGVKVGNYTRFE
jgi:hypothetical protein